MWRWIASLLGISALVLTLVLWSDGWPPAVSGAMGGATGGLVVLFGQAMQSHVTSAQERVRQRAREEAAGTALMVADWWRDRGPMKLESAEWEAQMAKIVGPLDRAYSSTWTDVRLVGCSLNRTAYWPAADSSPRQRLHEFARELME